MGRRRVLKATEVVFQRTDGVWILSTPTAAGFMHTRLGKSPRNKVEAEQAALRVLSS